MAESSTPAQPQDPKDAAREPPNEPNAVNAETPRQSQDRKDTTPERSSKGWFQLLTSLPGDGWALAVVVAVVAVSIASTVLAFVHPARTDVEIVARLTEAGNEKWNLAGRVLKQGTPLKDATVWAIARDDEGMRDAPPSQTTDASGSFLISSVPKKLLGPVGEVTVFAQGTSSWFSSAARGEETLLVGPGGGLRRVRSAWLWLLLYIPLMFVASALLPFLGGPTYWKYVVLLVFTVWLAASVIVGITLALKDVQTQADKEEVVSLGFASLFRGRYTADVDREWLISLTAAPERTGPASQSSVGSEPPPSARVTGGAAPGQAAPVTNARPAGSAPAEPPPRPPAAPAPGAPAGSDATLRGFGAPLWVVLLAVFGSGLMTVSLIVNEIKDRPTFPASTKPERDAVKAREEKIVRHQFFILFSPLSAIFVYQMLVAANTASQPLAVAVAMLGAGPVLNALLDKAVTTAQGFVSK